MLASPSFVVNGSKELLIRDIEISGAGGKTVTAYKFTKVESAFALAKNNLESGISPSMFEFILMNKYT